MNLFIIFMLIHCDESRRWTRARNSKNYWHISLTHLLANTHSQESHFQSCWMMWKFPHFNFILINQKQTLLFVQTMLLLHTQRRVKKTKFFFLSNFLNWMMASGGCGCCCVCWINEKRLADTSENKYEFYTHQLECKMKNLKILFT